MAEKVIDESAVPAGEEVKEAAAVVENGAAKVAAEESAEAVPAVVAAENGSAADAAPAVAEEAVDAAAATTTTAEAAVESSADSADAAAVPAAAETPAAAAAEEAVADAATEATNGDSTGTRSICPLKRISFTNDLILFSFATDAPAEAVKRKVSDEESAATVDDGESVPEKKAKLAAEEATNGEAKEEVAA